MHGRRSLPRTLIEISANPITAEGATVHVARTTKTPTPVRWFAIGSDD